MVRARRDVSERRGKNDNYTYTCTQPLPKLYYYCYVCVRENNSEKRGFETGRKDPEET